MMIMDSEVAVRVRYGVVDRWMIVSEHVRNGQGGRRKWVCRGSGGRRGEFYSMLPNVTL